MCCRHLYFQDFKIIFRICYTKSKIEYLSQDCMSFILIDLLLLRFSFAPNFRNTRYLLSNFYLRKYFQFSLSGIGEKRQIYHNLGNWIHELNFSVLSPIPKLHTLSLEKSETFIFSRLKESFVKPKFILLPRIFRNICKGFFMFYISFFHTGILI